MWADLRDSGDVGWAMPALAVGPTCIVDRSAVLSLKRLATSVLALGPAMGCVDFEVLTCMRFYVEGEALSAPWPPPNEAGGAGRGNVLDFF